MTIPLTDAQRARLVTFLEGFEDAEQLTPDEFVVDFYDLDVPLSINLVLDREGNARIDGAARLRYDEALDGWYMAERVEDAAEVLSAFREAGAWLDA